MHVLTCPKYHTRRPPNISNTYANPRKCHETLDLIRANNHFGIKNKKCEVSYIRLNIGQYWRNDHHCDQCDYVTDRGHNLYKHQRTVQGPGGSNTQCNPRATPSELTCSNCFRLHKRRREKLIHEERCIAGKSKQVRRCTECEYRSSGKNAIILDAEMATHLTDNHTAVQCHGCSSFYSGRKALVEQQRSNCGGSRY